MNDLNHLHFFAQVAKTQSFTLAARRLDLPKSTVSRALQSLENRLGLRLIERTTRRVTLTEAGALYLERCNRVLEEAELADQVVGAMQARPRGRLRIGATVTFVRAVLGPALPDFIKEYPDLRVQLRVNGTDTSGADDDLDVVIRPGPLEDSGLRAKPLMRVILGVFASPVYLKGKGSIASPEDLKHHRCITMGCGRRGDPADYVVWRLRRKSDHREVRVESHVAVPDPMISRQLALDHVGIAMLAETMVEKDLRQRKLVRVLPDWAPEPVDLYALYPSLLQQSPKVRAFVEFIRTRVPSGTNSRMVKAAAGPR
ncbi:MAG TPA: LysR family transcriptional regulator [Opitutaceae bacterium]|nr:LysR family transcriptional regulator [Opitutaceae bacterium]